MLLAQAADLAVAVARELVRHGDAMPPAVVQPILTWRKGTKVAAARRAALAALEDDAFRAAVLAEVERGNAPLDRPSWLVVARPEGWADELAAWGRAAEADRLADQLAEARAALAAATSALEDAVAALSLERKVRAEAERELGAARAEATALNDSLVAARADRDRRVNERQQAVRDLKRTERLLAERTAHLRAAEDRIAAITAEAPPNAASPPPEALPADALPPPAALLADLRAAVAVVADRQRALAAELAELVHPGSGRPAPPGYGAAEAPAAPRRALPAQPARRAVPMRRGLSADEAAGARWLLERPEALVLIDGYNVTKSAWDGLSLVDQRAALERGASAVAASTGASFVVVFDGTERGSARRRSRSAAVRVRFTPAGVEADDEILALIDEVPVAQPVIVVSDDRRVRDGARRRGANLLGARTFIELLRS